MLLFAHLGLTLAAARPFRNAALGYVLLGSMLPDIIDKPLGEMIFRTPNMGRTICHTLVSLMFLSIVAYHWRNSRLASLAGGVAAHLMLDSIWNSPRTFLWPLLGTFPRAPYLTTLDYLQQLFKGLSDPMIGLPEMLGLAYLIYFAWQRREKISCLAMGQIRQLASETRK
jgi:membrane-bound metal-dependent hydrolase YbcI (DUF457 family)